VAMQHVVCARLVCRCSFLYIVVEMGVCFWELGGLDCSYVTKATQRMSEVVPCERSEIRGPIPQVAGE